MRFVNAPLSFMAALNIPIEVAYAAPDKQIILSITVREGCTYREAIKKSGMLSHFPGIDLDSQKIGVFSKFRECDEVVGRFRSSGP